jgi:ABC-type uncharacterized transport system fused permease/ATPase subunit
VNGTNLRGFDHHGSEKSAADTAAMQILYSVAENIQPHTLHPLDPLIGSDMVRQSIDTVSRFTDYQQSFAELTHRYMRIAALLCTIRRPLPGHVIRGPPDPAVVER